MPLSSAYTRQLHWENRMNEFEAPRAGSLRPSKPLPLDRTPSEFRAHWCVPGWSAVGYRSGRGGAGTLLQRLGIVSSFRFSPMTTPPARHLSVDLGCSVNWHAIRMAVPMLDPSANCTYRSLAVQLLGFALINDIIMFFFYYLVAPSAGLPVDRRVKILYLPLMFLLRLLRQAMSAGPALFTREFCLVGPSCPLMETQKTLETLYQWHLSSWPNGAADERRRQPPARSAGLNGNNSPSKQTGGRSTRAPVWRRSKSRDQPDQRAAAPISEMGVSARPIATASRLPS